MKHPKAECESLLDEVILPFAKQMLCEYGEFRPYGAAMKVNGEIVSVAAHDGRESPPPVDTIELIKGAFVEAAQEGTYRATALAYDVRVTLPTSGEKTDAAAVSLNHADGYSVIVFFPYKIASGSVVFGDAIAQAGESDIFPPPTLS